jgi:hypothetical protein
MKRTLIALPLIALALGVLLFLFRKHEVFSILSRGPQAHSEGPGHSHDEKETPRTSPTASVPASQTAAIRFVITAGGVPVTDSKITVQRSGSNDFMVIATEKDGTQLLRGLPPAEYSLLVEHPKYKEHSAEVTLSPAQTLQFPVDLKTGARIHGYVRDRAGSPIPGTRVFLLVQGELPVTRSAVYTDDKGYYALNGVPQGAFGIRFRHKEYKPSDHPDLIFQTGAESYEVDKVLDYGLKASGRVLDEVGLPLEGAVVVVSNESSAGLSKTGKDGVFSVPGLNDIPVSVSATKQGYGKVEHHKVPLDGTELEIRLPKAGKIACKVVLEEPPRQVQVVLAKFDDGTRKEVMFDSKFFPDPPDGRFVYPDIAPGTYSLEMHIEGYVANERPRVTVAPGQTVEEVVVTFRKKV